MNALIEMARYLLLVIFTFVFIYYPPIFLTNALHILGIISWTIILLDYKSFFKLFKQGGYPKEILFSLLIMTYISMVLVLNGGTDLVVIYVFALVIMEILPICFTIIYLLRKFNKKRTFSDLIIHVGFLQSIFAIIAFLVPQFQSWVIKIMLLYGYKDVIVKLSGYRMFGLSYTFPYSMPIVQGVIACLSIYLGINKSAKYFIFAPLLIFSGIINARICIVITIIGVVLILFDSLRLKFKKRYKILILVLGFMLLFNPISKFIEEVSPATFAWINEGTSELNNLTYGDTSGSYISYIMDNGHYTLPSNIYFGTGARVIRGNYTYHSDIGYVNDIWLGGFIYAIIIYGYLFVRLNRIRRYFNINFANGTLISLFLFLVLAFSNLKGTIYSANEFLNLFYLVYIYSMCCERGLAEASDESKKWKYRRYL